ncbi:unnamed protein product [Prunus armeniaca]
MACMAKPPFQFKVPFGTPFEEKVWEPSDILHSPAIWHYLAAYWVPTWFTYIQLLFGNSTKNPPGMAKRGRSPPIVHHFQRDNYVADQYHTWTTWQEQPTCSPKCCNKRQQPQFVSEANCHTVLSRFSNKNLHERSKYRTAHPSRRLIKPPKSFEWPSISMLLDQLPNGNHAIGFLKASTWSKIPNLLELIHLQPISNIYCLVCVLPHKLLNNSVGHDSSGSHHFSPRTT